MKPSIQLCVVASLVAAVALLQASPSLAGCASNVHHVLDVPMAEAAVPWKVAEPSPMGSVRKVGYSEGGGLPVKITVAAGLHPLGELSPVTQDGPTTKFERVAGLDDDWADRVWILRNGFYKKPGAAKLEVIKQYGVPFWTMAIPVSGDRGGMVTVFVSQIIIEKHEHPTALLYVHTVDTETNEKIWAVNQIYQSNSHLLWRVKPFTKGGWFGKGFFEDDVTLPIVLNLALLQVNPNDYIISQGNRGVADQLSQLVENEEDARQSGFGNYNSRRQESGVVGAKVITKGGRQHQRKPESPRSRAKSARLERSPSMGKSCPIFTGDCTQGVLVSQIPLYTSALGKVTAFVTQSEDRTTSQCLFLQCDATDKIFLSTVELISKQITPYGVRHVTPACDMHPIMEYPQQVEHKWIITTVRLRNAWEVAVSNKAGRRFDWAQFPSLSYVDNWNVVRKSPGVVNFYEQVLKKAIPPPSEMGVKHRKVDSRTGDQTTQVYCTWKATINPCCREKGKQSRPDPVFIGISMKSKCLPNAYVPESTPLSDLCPFEC